MKRRQRSVKSAEMLMKSLYKAASEDGGNENLVKLIHQEAFDQLAEKFPNLLRYIIGIEQVKKIDDSTILSVAIISNGDIRLSVPVIYQNGNVDATSYIYEPESDIMLGLTKKIVNLFLGQRGTLGASLSNGDAPRLDRGDIRQLFVPPKTWSPKVASFGAFEQMLEKSAEFRYSVAKKIMTDDGYAYLIKKAYEQIPHIINDEAKLVSLEKRVGDKVITSSSEIEPWMNKEAAITELRRFGFVIIQARPPLKSLVPVQDTTPKSVFTQGGTKETIKAPGCYLVRDEISQDVKPIMVFQSIRDRGDELVMLDVDQGHESEIISQGVVGVKDPKCIARAKLLPATTMLAPLPKEYGLIVRMRDGSLRYLYRVFPRMVQVADDCSEIRISGYRKVVIKLSGYDAKPMELAGGTIIAGANDVFLYPVGTLIPETTATALENQASQGNVELICDGRQYILNGRRYRSAADVAQSMLRDGYDRQSIYSLIKTAQDNGSVVMTEVNAKLDTVLRGIVAIAGKIEDLEQRLASIEGGVPQEQEAPQEQEVQGMPEVQEEQAVSQSDSSFALQQPQPDAPAEVPTPSVQPGSTRVELLEGTMNPLADPAVVDKLLELKESGIVDTSLIALALDAGGVAEVAKEYLLDMLKGVSAMARITFNIQLHGNEIASSLGENRYKQLLSSFKGLVTQLTDAYAELALHVNQFGKQE